METCKSPRMVMRAMHVLGSRAVVRPAAVRRLAAGPRAGVHCRSEIRLGAEPSDRPAGHGVRSVIPPSIGRPRKDGGPALHFMRLAL